MRRIDTPARAAGQPEGKALTIGRLARSAGVGVETVRYYQRRALLPVPASSGDSAFRHYPVGLVERIRFIKRAQEAGFSLEEIAALLKLENSADRVAIRQVAGERLAQLHLKMAELQRMETLLAGLIDSCAHTGSNRPCPIIEAFAHSEQGALQPTAAVTQPRAGKSKGKTPGKLPSACGH